MSLRTPQPQSSGGRRNNLWTAAETDFHRGGTNRSKRVLTGANERGTLLGFNVQLHERAGMSEQSKIGDELSKLNLTQLAQAYVESVEAAEATEHVGRKNRFARRLAKIVQELKARGEARSVLQHLATHSNERVRAWARGNLDWLDKASSETVLKPSALRAQMLWQCDNPPPRALTRDEIAERLRQSVPKFCDRLMDLALPAIGLWPIRPTEIPATASRFGGTPLAPPYWRWPTVQEEPLLFVGQINCAQLRGLPSAALLPSSGLLAFFGDYEALYGCSPFDDRGVYFWPDVDRLVPAKAPIDPLEVFPSCALTPRPTLDLPHPFSRAVRELRMGKEQQSSYADAWWDIRDHGIPPDCVGYTGLSKLFGWPDLVQNDLWRFQSEDDSRLLLQVDKYCNGDDYHTWGPGGSLYYLLPEQDLRAGIFTRCELEGQFT